MSLQFRLFRCKYTKSVYRYIAEVNLPRLGANILYQSMSKTPIFAFPYQKLLTSKSIFCGNSRISSPFEKADPEEYFDILQEFMEYSIEVPNYENNIAIHTETLHAYEIKLSKNGNHEFWDL